MSDSPELSTLLKRTDVAVHLMGCGGAGMRALAEYAADLGWSVGGCDANLNERTRAKLEAIGVRTAGSHSVEHVIGKCDLLVFTPAVSTSHPEISAVLASGRLLVASTEGELVTLSPETGEQLGSLELGGGGVSVPPAIADGTAFFLTSNATLVAVR